VTYIGSEPYAPSYSGEETSPPDRIRLLFRAEATTQDEEHLDSRMCFLTVNFESGKVEHGKFTTNQGPGTWRIGIYPADDPVEHAQIRCRSIRASDS
jgi:hypothetical protein